MLVLGLASKLFDQATDQAYVFVLRFNHFFNVTFIISKAMLEKNKLLRREQKRDG